MIIYRASEYGRCVRASVAERLGYRALPPPDTLQDAFDRGNLHEDLCIEQLERDGYFVLNELVNHAVDQGQVFIHLSIADDVEITGHLDGIVSDTPYATSWMPRVLEVKAPNAYDKFERAVRTDTWDALTSRYAWQVSAYMVATGLECVVACWDEERGVRTFVIEEPIFSRERIVARILTIEEIAAAGELPVTCPVIEYNDWSCPFRYLHQREEDEDDTVLDAMVDQYELASNDVKLAESVKKDIQRQIREYLGTTMTRTTAHAKVTRYIQETETPDRDAMKRDGLWDERYVKQTASERLRVTLREKDDNVPTE